MTNRALLSALVLACFSIGCDGGSDDSLPPGDADTDTDTDSDTDTDTDADTDADPGPYDLIFSATEMGPVEGSVVRFKAFSNLDGANPVAFTQWTQSGATYGQTFTDILTTDMNRLGTYIWIDRNGDNVCNQGDGIYENILGSAAAQIKNDVTVNFKPNPNPTPAACSKF